MATSNWRTNNDLALDLDELSDVSKPSQLKRKEFCNFGLLPFNRRPSPEPEKDYPPNEDDLADVEPDFEEITKSIRKVKNFDDESHHNNGAESWFSPQKPTNNECQKFEMIFKQTDSEESSLEEPMEEVKQVVNVPEAKVESKIPKAGYSRVNVAMASIIELNKQKEEEKKKAAMAENVKSNVLNNESAHKSVFKPLTLNEVINKNNALKLREANKDLSLEVVDPRKKVKGWLENKPEEHPKVEPPKPLCRDVILDPRSMALRIVAETRPAPTTSNAPRSSNTSSVSSKADSNKSEFDKIYQMFKGKQNDVKKVVPVEMDGKIQMTSNTIFDYISKKKAEIPKK